MLSKKYPRVKRAIKFFVLSFSLFVVVLFWWIYNNLLDAEPGVGLTIKYWEWVGWVFVYITFVAVLLWVFSKTNKEAWKVIAELTGWKDDEESQVPKNP
jgi:cbb3-type cytochrome oxidase subunit 3